nr:hypothetical protein [[Phormidium] sp. ETS-05]
MKVAQLVMVCVPLSSFTGMGLVAVKLGGSLTGLMVRLLTGLMVRLLTGLMVRFTVAGVA